MNTQIPGKKFRRIPFVLDKYDRSRASLYRDIKASRFPKPVRLGPNSIGWHDDTLEAHDKALIEKASEESAA